MRTLSLGCGLLLLAACGTPGTPRDGGTGGGSGAGGGNQSFYMPLLGAPLESLGFAVAKQGSKIVLGGSGKLEGANRGGDLLLTRVDATAALDTTFGTGGYTLTDADGGTVALTVTYNSDTVNAVLIDGSSIIVAGSARGPFAPGEGEALMLGKYGADGIIDSTFGNTAGLQLNSPGSKITGQFSSLIKTTGGKYVAAGNVNGDFAVIRYNTNGTPDSTFSKDGTVIGNISGSGSYEEFGYGLVEQASGKIVVAGGQGFSMLRLNTDGTNDITFGPNGTGFTRGVDTPGAYLAQVAGGALMMAGLYTYLDGNDYKYELRVFKATADGIPDPTFGTVGLRKTPVPWAKGMGPIRGLVWSDDGSFIFYFTSADGAFLAKMNADGTIDMAFGANQGRKKIDIVFPALGGGQDASTNHLLIDGSTAWVVDLNLQLYAAPEKYRNFLTVVKVAL